jgi:hypothetical protein
MLWTLRAGKVVQVMWFPTREDAVRSVAMGTDRIA